MPSADQAIYQPVEYTNVNKKGRRWSSFPARSRATTRPSCRSSRRTTSPTSARSSSRPPTSRCWSARTSGPLLNEFALAYNLGDPDAARKFLRHGQAEEHQVRREVRHPEDRAGRRGAVRASTAARSGRWPDCWASSAVHAAAQAGAVAGAGIGSVHTSESSGVWIIGMRYKIINAETTEQVAQGYTEEKMEVGAKSTSVLGVSESQQGGVSLDTMVQRAGAEVGVGNRQQVQVIALTARDSATPARRRRRRFQVRKRATQASAAAHDSVRSWKYEIRREIWAAARWAWSTRPTTR